MTTVEQVPVTVTDTEPQVFDICGGMIPARHLCPVCNRMCKPVHKGTGLPRGRPRQEFCKRGHKMSDTVRTGPSGRRYHCQECNRQAAGHRNADQRGRAIVERVFPPAKGF